MKTTEDCYMFNLPPESLYTNKLKYYFANSSVSFTEDTALVILENDCIGVMIFSAID